MKSQHIPMTIAEFHMMPRQLGWKHEYWDGQAHIMPSHSGVVTATVAVQPRPVRASCMIRPVTEADLPGLYPAYLAAFQDTIDYCDWQLPDIETAAHENLTNFFAGKRGQPLSAAQVAIHAATVVGAALLVQKRNGQPFLDLLFVVPDWHRKGVATALVATALNALAAAGYQSLVSRFWLGNVESRTWHHNFGFVDEPDLFVMRAYYAHAQDELNRREALGNLTPAEHTALVAERDHWDKAIKELEAIADAQGLTAVTPLLWYND